MSSCLDHRDRVVRAVLVEDLLGGLVDAVAVLGADLVDGLLEQRRLLLAHLLVRLVADEDPVDADVVVVEDRRVEHLVVARRVRRDDRVLLADGDALLQRGVDLLDRDGDRVGHAERLGVGQELRRVREPDRHAGEVVGAVDLDVLRREGAGAEEPAVDDVDAGGLVEAR